MCWLLHLCDLVQYILARPRQLPACVSVTVRDVLSALLLINLRQSVSSMIVTVVNSYGGAARCLGLTLHLVQYVAFWCIEDVRYTWYKMLFPDLTAL